MDCLLSLAVPVLALSASAAAFPTNRTSSLLWGTNTTSINATFTNTTSIKTTSINTPSINIPSINIPSINVTFTDNTSIGTPSITIPSINIPPINATSTNTTSISTRSVNATSTNTTYINTTSINATSINTPSFNATINNATSIDLISTNAAPSRPKYCKEEPKASKDTTDQGAPTRSDCRSLAQVVWDYTEGDGDVTRTIWTVSAGEPTTLVHGTCELTLEVDECRNCARKAVATLTQRDLASILNHAVKRFGSLRLMAGTGRASCSGPASSAQVTVRWHIASPLEA